MENPKIIAKFCSAVKESEKERLISSSGSTRGDGNEKIRAGQSYLYKLHAMESEVIEVRFQNGVWGSHLNVALREALRRYPYFNTRLIEKEGDFYIVQNDIAPVARKTRKLYRLGGMSCNRHLVDVTYCGNSLFISFHHALCDGRGIKPFVETLLFYYCLHRYHGEEYIEGVRRAEDGLLEGETDDPFLHPYKYDADKEFPSLSRNAFAIPEGGGGETKNFRYELKFPHGEFMSVCKVNNATPVVLLSLAASRAIAALYPSYDKPINANIAADMREALGMQNTYKNCVRSMVLPYTREVAALPLKEAASQYRELLRRQRDPDFCRREANAMMSLFDRLDALGSFREKQDTMAFFEKMRLDTYVISYLGQFVLGSNERYIESIHLYNSGTAGLGINMISAGGYFIVDIKQDFETDKYAKGLQAQLEHLGIAAELSDKIEFETPADELIKRK